MTKWANANEGMNKSLIWQAGKKFNSLEFCLWFLKKFNYLFICPFFKGLFLCFKTTYFILLNGTQKLRFWLCLPQKNLTFSQLFSGDPTSLKLRTRRTAGFALRATQNPPLGFCWSFAFWHSASNSLFKEFFTSLKLRTRRTAGFALRATQNPLLNFHNFKIGADFKICKNRSFYIINWIHRVNFN